MQMPIILVWNPHPSLEELVLHWQDDERNEGAGYNSGQARSRLDHDQWLVFDEVADNVHDAVQIACHHRQFTEVCGRGRREGHSGSGVCICVRQEQRARVLERMRVNITYRCCSFLLHVGSLILLFSHCICRCTPERVYCRKKRAKGTISEITGIYSRYRTG